MEEFFYQFKTNRVVKWTVLSAFVLVAFVFSERSVFTGIFTLLGIALGRLSYNDHVDRMDV